MSKGMFDLMSTVIKKNKSRYDIDDSLYCNVCHSQNIVIREPCDIHVCLDCKSTLGAEIDFKPEWRTDSTGIDMTRCSMPINDILPESSMVTCIGGRNTGKLSHDLSRLLKWNSVPHSERSMRSKIDDIEYICKQHGIPDAIIVYAQENYSKVINQLEKEHMKRRRANKDKGLKAAAVYISFTDDHKPKTYQEIADIFQIETKYVTSGVSLFNKLLKKNYHTQCSDFINEYSNSLNMKPEHIKRVKELVEKVKVLGISENNKITSVIAGCISYVSHEYDLDIKPQDIHSRCNVSIPTINKVCEKLMKRSIELL
jgi:transcription initiation factor TFIIIB Brf1 subunit/transcription initiation factor TFIIB